VQGAEAGNGTKGSQEDGVEAFHGSGEVRAQHGGEPWAVIVAG
jgi:hypothetical protein